MTGISASEYGRIRGAVANHALLQAGAAIPIAVENGPRLIAAVDALRREAAAVPAPPADFTAEAERRFEKPAARLTPLDTRGRLLLQTAIGER